MAKQVSDLQQAWMKKLMFALKVHEEKVEKKYAQVLQYFQGKQWAGDDVESYNDKTVDNLYYSIVSTIKPAIVLNRPKVFAKPRRATIRLSNGEIDSTSAALRMEGLMDFLFDELEIQDEVEKAVVDALLAPEGYVMTGFDGSSPESDLVSMVDNEEVFVRRKSPVDIIRDPENTDPDMKTDRYIFIRWVKSLAEVKKDTTLKNTGDLQANMVIQVDKKDKTGNTWSIRRWLDDTDSVFQTDDDDIARVEGFDIWDKENQEYLVIVPTHTELLRADKEWPTKYDRYPVVSLWFNYNPDNSHALADTDIYKSKQDIINRLLSKMMDHMRKASDRKFAFNKRSVDKKNMEDFAKGPADSVIACKGDPNAAIATISDTGISSDVYNVINLLKQDVFREMGINQFESGSAGSLPTAQQSTDTKQSVSPKRHDRSKAVEKFYVKILKNIMSVVAQHVDAESEVPVGEGNFDSLQQNDPQALVSRPRGQDAQGQTVIEYFPFMKIDKELLQAKFGFKIVAGSTASEGEAERMQRAQLLYNFAVSNPLIDKTEATKIVLELGGFEEYMGRLLRDPKVVAQEQQASGQKRVADAIAVDKPKRDTDMKKTQLKSITQLAIETLKSEDREDTEDNKLALGMLDAMASLIKEREHHE